MSKKDWTKNDYAWEKLFNKYKILDTINKEGFFKISSRQINEVREARLMTKFDQKSNLPILFKDNNLSILPISRGNYLIGKFKAYEDIEYKEDIEPIEFNLINSFESLDLDNLYSEASALHAAYLGDIISDIIGEQAYPTISGRMSTGQFSFEIISEKENTFPISVKNSQCEIDGGFESDTKLLLVEAKNFEVDNFLIRQIYYPYRLWRDKINKEVIPAFFTYSNDVFSFFIYEFQDDNRYNSIKLVEQRNYITRQEPISIDDIYTLLKEINIVKEPEVPFPQADTFERVIDLLGLLMNGSLNKEEITLNYSFDKRQTDYYVNAGRYLGLVDTKRKKDEVLCFLTDEGKKVMNKRHREKKLDIVGKILEHEVFNKSLYLYFKTLSPISVENVVEIMNNSYIYNVEKDSSTIGRRAQSVVKWINWILDLAE